ncbi:hypothetical protein Fcan01_25319 [Folsomia candida]|uniref:Uncharacterized protein n=1 Tax=Folsomia candida TaxID=158441 RepID=A0A226D484_FOLCA|nr:hypothetical protein Fcan01_25319 [Folsomia candida]
MGAGVLSASLGAGERAGLNDSNRGGDDCYQEDGDSIFNYYSFNNFESKTYGSECGGRFAVRIQKSRVDLKVWSPTLATIKNNIRKEWQVYEDPDCSNSVGKNYYLLDHLQFFDVNYSLCIFVEGWLNVDLLTVPGLFTPTNFIPPVPTLMKGVLTGIVEGGYQGLLPVLG